MRDDDFATGTVMFLIPKRCQVVVLNFTSVFVPFHDFCSAIKHNH